MHVECFTSLERVCVLMRKGKKEEARTNREEDRRKETGRKEGRKGK